MMPELDQTTMAAIARIVNFIEKNPDGFDRLESLLARERRLLLTTDEVMAMTGWSRGYIQKLCQSGKLPHIPGKPLRFMREPLLTAIERMLEGQGYRKRRSSHREKP